jgi:DNA-binding GntR family transcriptional regulator
MDAKIPAGYGPDDQVDHDGPDPVWLQVAAILLARIGRGDYPPRRAIPSESQVMAEFGLARGTVRKAVALLAELGYAQTVPGRGTFVVARQEDASEPGGA